MSIVTDFLDFFMGSNFSDVSLLFTESSMFLVLSRFHPDFWVSSVKENLFFEFYNENFFWIPESGSDSEILASQNPSTVTGYIFNV